MAENIPEFLAEHRAQIEVYLGASAAVTEQTEKAGQVARLEGIPEELTAYTVSYLGAGQAASYKELLLAREGLPLQDIQEKRAAAVRELGELAAREAELDAGDPAVHKVIEQLDAIVDDAGFREGLMNTLATMTGARRARLQDEQGRVRALHDLLASLMEPPVPALLSDEARQGIEAEVRAIVVGNGEAAGGSVAQYASGELVRGIIRELDGQDIDRIGRISYALISRKGVYFSSEQLAEIMFGESDPHAVRRTIGQLYHLRQGKRRSSWQLAEQKLRIEDVQRRVTTNGVRAPASFHRAVPIAR